MFELEPACLISTRAFLSEFWNHAKKKIDASIKCISLSVKIVRPSKFIQPSPVAHFVHTDRIANCPIEIACCDARMPSSFLHALYPT